MNNQIKLFSLTTLTFYSIFNGIVYQWSFWDCFNVNIMQFISINDLLPQIAVAIALPLALLGAYAFMMTLFFRSQTFGKIFNYASPVKLESSSTNLIQLPTRNEKNTLSLNKRDQIKVYILITLAALCFVFYSIYLYKTDGMKELTMMILSISMMILIIKIKEFTSSLGKYAFPAMLIISLMPHLMFVSGRANANIIIKGKNSYIIKSESICNKENKNEKFRFIANISDKAFAYSLSDKSICIFKYDSLMLIKENSINEVSLNPLPSNRI